MSGIRYVITTALFWKTLAQYRRHGNYLTLRDKIDETVYHKVQDRHHRTQRDKPFEATSKLRDIWHTHLSKELDAVLFYTLSGDDLTLALVGNHGDYPNAGKNKSKEAPFAARIWKAVGDGHVPSPAWQKIRWSHPGELIGHRDLPEMDARAIDALRWEIREETRNFVHFEKLTGLDHLDDDNVEEVLAYLDTLEKVDNELAHAAMNAKLSFEKHADRMPAAKFRKSASCSR
jgi:mRNA-degrading endonuclease YafQ of YafQ-DinJ toxin-antitoxin module